MDQFPGLARTLLTNDNRCPARWGGRPNAAAQTFLVVFLAQAAVSAVLWLRALYYLRSHPVAASDPDAKNRVTVSFVVRMLVGLAATTAYVTVRQRQCRLTEALAVLVVLPIVVQVLYAGARYAVGH